MTPGVAVSHHFLRRTARAKARRLRAQALQRAAATGEASAPGFYVRRALRGPYRYRVELVTDATRADRIERL